MRDPTTIQRNLALLVLCLAPWPLLRAGASRPFRRQLPRLARLLTGLVAAYLLAVVATTVLLPAALPLLAAGAATLLLVERWRARPAYGCARGLPPGSLALLPLGVWLERNFFERQFARYGPVVKVQPVLRPVVCVQGLQRGLDLLTRPIDELAPIPLGFSRFITGGFLRYMEGETHRRHRQHFQRAFSAAVLADREPSVRRALRDALGRMADDGPVGPEPYLQRALFAAWVELFLGLPPDSDAFRRLQGLYRVIDMRNPLRASDTAIRQALADIRAIARAELRSDRAASGSSFLGELARAAPDAVADDGTMDNLIFMLHTSWSDVAGLLLWMCKMLGDGPSWLSHVRDAAPAEADELATRIVLETLRLAQMEHLYRKALRPVRLGEFVIPKGWLIRICVRESHLDETVFPNARAFDPDRFRDRSYAASQFTPFGVSTHACLGQQFTLTVGKLFVTELARGFDCTIVADGPPEFSSWLHWHPSSKLRLRLTRLAAAA